MSPSPSIQPAVATLTIGGMHCAACADRVTKALTSLPGVQAAEVSLEERRATVTYDPGQVTPDSLRQAITAADYTVEGIQV
ncbi:MAG: heavy-metal-associated domain-containing protein [Desulfobacca sp.]|uniref:heavy-metal-associated domain-containing protein n=1 Tax=Desulfobacca sp. TaxID=2067990 RepID=UPI00404A23A3